MTKINHEEYEVLKERYDMGGEWIARDANGLLYYHSRRPNKLEHSSDNVWDSNSFPMGTIEDGKKLFHFVKWTDSEPYNITELIKEYESEGKVMKKDIEWLKKEIGTEMIQLEPNRKERWSDVKYQTLRSVAQKLNQLDEPEVLSQEWVEEHKVSRINNLRKMTMSDVVPVGDLQDLLVPKQEITFDQVHDKLREESILSEKSFDYYWNCINDDVEIDELVNLLVPKQEEITELDALNRLAQNVQFSADEIANHLEKLSAHNGQVTYGNQETLSQEWINEHRKSYTMEDSVEISELQNLLVPKQELPVIPKYVADWIEDLKSKKINLLENIYDFTHEEDIYNYIREQGNELMRAWLDGYEVEEVKRYIVEIGRKNVLWAENGRFKILPKDYYILDDKYYHILTRAEIENYDASLMEFAKEAAE